MRFDVILKALISSKKLTKNCSLNGTYHGLMLSSYSEQVTDKTIR